jgi:hypothetical protein
MNRAALNGTLAPLWIALAICLPLIVLVVVHYLRRRGSYARTPGRLTIARQKLHPVVAIAVYLIMFVSATLIASAHRLTDWSQLSELMDPKAWLGAVLGVIIFPLGLAVIALTDRSSELTVLIAVTVSYAAYLVFFLFFLRARTWTTIALLSILFACLLLLNVSGCRKVSEYLSHIN